MEVALKLICDTRDRILRQIQSQGCDDDFEFPPLPSNCVNENATATAACRTSHPARVLPQQAESSRPIGHLSLQQPHGFQSIKEYKGTQEEIDRMQSVCSRRFDAEQYLVDELSPYKGTVEVVEEAPTPSLQGLLRDPASARPRRPLLLCRKTLKISIPRDTFTDDWGGPLPKRRGHPLYTVQVEELLPPRQYTPSPEVAYHRGQRPRSATQLRRRQAQETRQQRVQEHVPSREPREAVEERFGDIERDDVELPGRYWRMRRNRPMDLGEVHRCLREDPTFHEWYTR